MLRVGVFDSGIGGKSVANAIVKALPDVKVTYVNDSKNVPYGTKTPDQLFKLVLPILKDVSAKTDVIVIACNSVTTTLIDKLRKELAVPLIGMEPMVEAAKNTTKSGVIAICATPTTLNSQRYQQLKTTYAKDILIYEPDCKDWAFMIENDRVDRLIITTQIKEACDVGADVIVLGCTHYHWIEDLIKEVLGKRATVLQPEKMVITEIKQVLART